MTPAVSHFDDEAWADFVRGVAPAALATEMERHLQTECPICSVAYATWSAVRSTVMRQAKVQPPETLVRSMKAAFAFRRRVPLLEHIAEMGRLVFDSLREPLPAGIRGGNLAGRHLVHEAGRYSIDLRLEREQRGIAHVAGQIVDREAPLSGTGGIGVVLVQREQLLVAQTVTNSLGEFELECEHENALRIYFETPGSAPVGIELPDSDQWTVSP